MELTHLVRTLSALPARRPWLSFLLGGLLLGGVHRGVGAAEPPPPQPLLVSVAASASPAEIERAVDDSVLTDFAARAQPPAADPAIRARLIQNMRFVDERLAPDDALERALELGMQRTDPVIRRRLEWLARQALARVTYEPPAEPELLAYLLEHRERFATPPRIRFAQILLSRQRRGAELEQAAEALGARLARERPPASAATRLGDPSLLPRQSRWLTSLQLDSTFGPGFGRRVLEAAAGEWTGPIPSSFGLHFVYVLERRAGALPPLGQIGDRVAYELEQDRRGRRVSQAVRRLRSAYDIRLERTP